MVVWPRTRYPEVNEQSSAADMQAQFYNAFARGDLEAMMAVWSEQESVVCIHPGHVPIVGTDAVRRSWSQILDAGDLDVSVSPIEQWIYDDFATIVVTEHLYVPSQRIRAETLATNAFRKETSGWKLVLHHGSPKPQGTTRNVSKAPQELH